MRVAARLARAHHAVAAVNANAKLIASGVGAERGGLGRHLLTHAGEEIVEPADQQRIARAADADRAIAGQLHPLQL